MALDKQNTNNLKASEAEEMREQVMRRGYHPSQPTHLVATAHKSRPRLPQIGGERASKVAEAYYLWLLTTLGGIHVKATHGPLKPVGERASNAAAHNHAGYRDPLGGNRIIATRGPPKNYWRWKNG